MAQRASEGDTPLLARRAYRISLACFGNGALHLPETFP